MKPHELLDPDFHSFLNPGTDPWSLDTLPIIRRLSRAGVAVELHVYPGAPHMFDQNPGRIIAQSHLDILRALKEFFKVH